MDTDNVQSGVIDSKAAFEVLRLYLSETPRLSSGLALEVRYYFHRLEEALRSARRARLAERAA